MSLPRSIVLEVEQVKCIEADTVGFLRRKVRSAVTILDIGLTIDDCLLAAGARTIEKYWSFQSYPLGVPAEALGKR
jgi:hypothetical protein